MERETSKKRYVLQHVDEEEPPGYLAVVEAAQVEEQVGGETRMTTQTMMPGTEVAVRLHEAVAHVVQAQALRDPKGVVVAHPRRADEVPPILEEMGPLCQGRSILETKVRPEASS